MHIKWLLIFLGAAVLSAGAVLTYQYLALPELSLSSLPLEQNKPGNKPLPAEPVKPIRENPVLLKEVAQDLLTEFLSSSVANDAPESTRISSFEIHDLKIDMVDADCFGFTADFSVQLSSKAQSTSSPWLAGNGTIDGAWVRHKTMFFNVQDVNGAFRIAESGTGRIQESCRSGL